MTTNKPGNGNAGRAVTQWVPLIPSNVALSDQTALSHKTRYGQNERDLCSQSKSKTKTKTEDWAQNAYWLTLKCFKWSKTRKSPSQVQVVFVFTVVVVVVVAVDVVANKWKWNELVNAYGGRDVAALKELFTGATQRLLGKTPRDPREEPPVPVPDQWAIEATRHTAIASRNRKFEIID